MSATQLIEAFHVALDQYQQDGRRWPLLWRFLPVARLPESSELIAFSQYLAQMFPDEYCGEGYWHGAAFCPECFKSWTMRPYEIPNQPTAVLNLVGFIRTAVEAEMDHDALELLANASEVTVDTYGHVIVTLPTGYVSTALQVEAGLNTTTWRTDA